MLLFVIYTVNLTTDVVVCNLQSSPFYRVVHVLSLSEMYVNQLAFLN